MSIRIAVLVSGGGTNLQAILDASKAGQIPHGEIACVISSKPDAYALERAKNAGVEALCANRKELGSLEAFEAQITKYLTERNIEVIVLAGFMSILSEDFVRRYDGRMINVHPALLPAFGGKGYYGLRVHQAVLDAGCKVTGATVHLVNEVCDGGEILLQKAVDILPGDTPETLQRRVMEQAEWDLLPKAVELLCARFSEQTND